MPGKRDGQALIMVTLLLVPMIGFLGLVTDLGYMHFLKMSAQTAAQAAAQAAIIDFHATQSGSNFSCGGTVVCSASPTLCPASLTDPQNSIERGCMYAQQHGFNSAGNQSVTYQAGTGSVPPTAPGSGTASYWVTFRVIQTVPQMFSAVLGNTTGTVAARSTAALIGGSDCIFAMNRHASGALSVGGNATMVSDCGIYVNSDNGTALTTNGGGYLKASEYDVVGGVSTQSPLDPTPNTGAAPVTDPLANLAPPATNGHNPYPPYHCDYLNYSASNWTTQWLNPGVYCGGIDVKNNVYHLNPGMYILVGGGLTTQSTNSHIDGTGVTFYNTFGATDQGSFAYSPINISANSTASLKAPYTGDYAGILFFEDRAAPPSSDFYGGGATATYEGVIYARNAAITMVGNSGANAKYTLLVADTINITGTADFKSDYSLLPTGSPIQAVVVLE